jgi:hypothetical protein
MMTRALRLLAIGLLAVVVLGWAAPASAQQYTGRIEVTAEDSTGARLPGVTVELSGPFNQSTVSDARGEARFLGLAPGTYIITCSLAGFRDYKNTNVFVAIGANAQLKATLAVSGVQQQVEVTAESPIIDTKKQGTSTSVNLDELQNIPTARDPWVVMQSVPGVVMDRVNVGGSESGQQAGFMSKGAGSGQTTWNVDGMPITDMSSLSSPFYYDFDMFSEMSVVTGGADAKSATSGVQMNFMLKSGTNSFHGNAKYYFENEAMQATNISAEEAKSLGSTTGKSNRTDLFQDWGGDVGGPIIKDRLWFWGAYGNQDIRIITLQGVSDETFLKNVSFKANGQILKSLRGSFTFFQADKSKLGRGNGWWTAFNQGSTMDQGGYGGPNRMYKGELNYVGGSNFFMVGRYAYVKGGFQLIPHGGSNTPTWVDANAQSHDSAYTYISSRPQQSLVLDGNYFMGKHELKFGFTWRKAEVHSTSTWANDSFTDTYGAATGMPVFAGTGAYPYMVVSVNAPYASDTSAKYYNFYAGDTITLNRMTINLGLRYDRQIASVLPSTLASPVAPFNTILPAITAPGVNNALTFGVFQPRVGMTYAVNESRKTQVRATYAMFTDQIGAGTAGFLSVAQYRGFYIAAFDANGDKIAQPGEIISSSYKSYIDDGDYWGYDPSNPNKVPTTIHKVGDYGNPTTHEMIVGIDHELMPNFGISASYTFRNVGSQNWRPIMCSSCGTGYVNGTNYTLKGNVTGNLPSGVPGSADGTYSVPYYGLTTGTVYDPAKGTIYTNRPDYHQTYQGFEITATKRMSNKWMARLGFSTNTWREYFGSANGQTNPTPVMGNPNVDGGLVMMASSGSGKSNIYMVQPTYQLIANGAYQLPWDIDLGASYLLRQGYPMPWNRSTSGGFTDTLGSTKNLLLVPEVNYGSLPAVQTLDFRVGKRIKMGKTYASIDFDVFNLVNSSTVLQRQYKYTASNYTKPLEFMQPRIARLGLRFTF